MAMTDAPTLLHQLFLVAKYYRVIGLSAAELEIVLALLVHQCEHPDAPLSNRALGLRVGKVPRAVQASLYGLLDRDLVASRPSFNVDGGRSANYYDLSPLFAAIEEVAQ